MVNQNHSLEIAALKRFGDEAVHDSFSRELLSNNPIGHHSRSVLELFSYDPGTALIFGSRMFPVEFMVPGNAVSPLVTTTVVENWLKRTGITYECGLIKDRKQIGPRGAISDLTVIDCKHELLKLVPLPPEELYVTLSYVWGDPLDTEYEAVRDGTLLAKLPQTIQDSVEITKSLGFRFLWIDRYCIPQTDDEIQSRLIACMDVIYSNSSLTLIACVGSNPHYGLTGISRTRVQRSCIDGYQFVPSALDVHASVWASRGWTFQEGLLSRRRLYFTDYHLIFQSKGITENEITSSPSGQVNNLIDDSIPSYEGRPTVYRIRLLLSCISLYSKRKMSRPEIDRLMALSGIFSARNIRHLWGLPFDHTSVNSNLTFVISLCWERQRIQSPLTMAPYTGFPTWSWASFPGPVIYWGLDWLEKPRVVQSHVEIRGVELATGTIISWEEYRARCQSTNYDIRNLNKFIYISARSAFSLRYRGRDSYGIHTKEVKMVRSGGHAFSQRITVSLDLLETALTGTDVLLAIHVGVPAADDDERSMILVLREKSDFWERIGLAWGKMEDKEQWKMEPKDLRLG